MLERKIDVQEKPPIYMGWVWKTGGLIFNVQERFIVVDPEEGTLIRYKKREHYPFKPMF